MNKYQEFQKVKEEIRSSGGEQSAQILDMIFENYHSMLTNEFFDAENFLNQLWQDFCSDNSNTIDRLKSDIILRIGGDNMNLIPSDTPGTCRSFCLAIASGSFDEKYYPSSGKTGFKGMMMKLVETWFKCLPINMENLILTSDWKESTFKDLYKKVINAYCQTHGKRVFIVLVSDSNIRVMYVV